ncbi:MAG TPA: excinuclease ABC subunit UvrA [Aggregatilinea sp.]|uniref:excinuclease ABC subunit UvrA n=1 Tax=Aggregatilinea sp. TaxID=2806333 RepID=UPI002BD8D46B|nr:excinuclease ABC subunit UvrA [Aggregatilinea sp.]HML20234.1 excinuclease ABC subunit UvrA [Aggregatilinea sp.]
MTHNAIKITGARENNLKAVSLEIPKHQITVFTGVSGAGKSSLVFDTIAAESQRQLNATMTNYLPLAGQPDADAIEHLSAAVVINQKQIRGNSRSTVGTITDIYSVLRLLYSRIGEPYVGFSNAFSFNEPEGMCPECDGLGKIHGLDLAKLLETSRSLNEGAIRFSMLHFEWQRYVQSGVFDGDRKLNEYSDADLDRLLHGEMEVELMTNVGTIKRRYEGLVDTFTRRYIKRDISTLSDDTREAIGRMTSQTVCPLCHGARINQAALNSTINGYNIAQLAAMEASELAEVVAQIQHPTAAPIVSSIVEGLRSLIAMGLGYLTLDRETMTLSGGEAQRIKMVRILGSSLTDLAYIFDEPTIGLHPRDVQGLNDLLRKLRDQGNTVLVVEHDPDTIEIADHIVDMGPGAGVHGGEIVYQGTVAGLYDADTLTGRHISHRMPVKTQVRQPVRWMRLDHVSRHNLHDVTVAIPVGVLTAITGVAGAGKSTLLEVFLESHPEAVVVDQLPIRTSTRSIPATYTGIMDDIRDLFARTNRVSKSLFSFNSAGACPVCEGLGVLYIELPFMDPVKTTCEACGGRRYKDDVLAYTIHGSTIGDVLDMTVSEALAFFEASPMRRTLAALEDVGLGYLRLGQPLSSLSGGECQRLKLANELHKTGSVYVLDEPTIGLHMADLTQMLAIFNRLVEEGNSVIVIEHNLDIVKNADWVIDLGPEGGTRGGQVVFEGTPRQLLQADQSYTAEYLRRDLRERLPR